MNLKVKDHCVRAVFFTSSGVSEMDYAFKKTCWLWTLLNVGKQFYVVFSSFILILCSIQGGVNAICTVDQGTDSVLLSLICENLIIMLNREQGVHFALSS